MLGDSQMLTLWFYGSAALKTSGPQYESGAIVGCGLFDPGVQPGSSCTGRAHTWSALIRSFDPDLSVLLVGAWETLDYTVAGRVYVHGTPAHERELVSIVGRALRPLTVRGGHVALLEVPPFGNPLGDADGRQRSDPAAVADVNSALRAVARERPDVVTFVPWADVIAPGRRFASSVNGVSVRPDGVHFASEGATRLATRRLIPILRRLAVEARESREASAPR
jgi:hypothetical protein